MNVWNAHVFVKFDIEKRSIKPLSLCESLWDLLYKTIIVSYSAHSWPRHWQLIWSWGKGWRQHTSQNDSENNKKKIWYQTLILIIDVCWVMIIFKVKRNPKIRSFFWSDYLPVWIPLWPPVAMATNLKVYKYFLSLLYCAPFSYSTTSWFNC